MSKISRFCISKHVRDEVTVPCSPEAFDAIVDDPRVHDTLERLKTLAAAGDTKAYRALKESLPVCCYHAMRFEGNKRNVDNAVRSGLAMFDLDHIADPTALWQTFVERGGLTQFVVALAHTTPSMEGLRIVVERREGVSIAEEQRRLAEFLSLRTYDASTCDDARASFVVARDRILFMDNSVLWYDDEDTPENRQRIEADNQQRYPGSKARGAAKPAAQPTAQPTDTPIAASYDDSLKFGSLPYADIIDRYFLKKLGRQPMEGERNVQLLAAARDLYCISEGSEEKLKQILPSLGLSNEEMDSVVHNAAAYRRANPVAKIPYALWSVIKELEQERHVTTDIGEEFEEGVEETVPDEVLEAEQRIPALPPVIRELVGIAPAGFKIPSLIACLAPMGTALTQLRAPYIDGQMTFPGFHVVIEAPQASGKSFAGRVVDTILRYVKAHDQEQRAIEREYERQARLNKNAKRQEDDPRVIIEVVPASISIAKALKRFDQSQGLGLFSFSAELDTMTNSNKRGGWSQKTDLYRLGYEGGEYGVDYMSENSYSATVTVRYNILSTGTPNAVDRFYHDCEDGLNSRVLFCSLANQQFRSLPVWGKFTKGQARIVDTKLHEAYALSYDEAGGVQPEYVMRMPWLCGEMNLWLERRRLEAAKSGSVAMDTFRRRAALNGFRAGMMAWWLWGENTRHRKETADFALFVADLTLNGQMHRFAGQLESDADKASVNTLATTRVSELFDSLPATFTTAQVATAATKQGIKSIPRKLIYNWRIAGLIEKVNQEYHKLS